MPLVKIDDSVIWFPDEMDLQEIEDVSRTLVDGFKRDFERVGGTTKDFLSRLAEGSVIVSTLKDMKPRDQAALATSMIPGVGDAIGVNADINDMKDRWTDAPWYDKAAMVGGTAMGALPFVPSRSQVKALSKSVSSADLGDIATGSPIQAGYARNTTPAPDMGDRFGQDIEPAGRYMRLHKGEPANPLEGLEYGDVTFNQPLVIDNANLEWKKRLSEAYDGLTGEDLSRAVAADGYDGIVTVDYASNGQPYTSESIDISMFSPKAGTEAAKETITAYHGTGYPFWDEGETILVQKGGAGIDGPDGVSLTPNTKTAAYYARKANPKGGVVGEYEITGNIHPSYMQAFEEAEEKGVDVFDYLQENFDGFYHDDLDEYRVFSPSNLLPKGTAMELPPPFTREDLISFVDNNPDVPIEEIESAVNNFNFGAVEAIPDELLEILLKK